MTLTPTLTTIFLSAALWAFLALSAFWNVDSLRRALGRFRLLERYRTFFCLSEGSAAVPFA